LKRVSIVFEIRALFKEKDSIASWEPLETCRCRWLIHNCSLTRNLNICAQPHEELLVTLLPASQLPEVANNFDVLEVTPAAVVRALRCNESLHRPRLSG